jgi:hypothetical protein
MMLLLLLAAAPAPHVTLVQVHATESTAAVKKALQAQVDPLEGCANLALKSKPRVQGTLTVTFELEPGSGVTTLAASPDSLQDDTLVPCALARLRSGPWPDVKKRLTVTATYRFSR